MYLILCTCIICSLATIDNTHEHAMRGNMIICKVYNLPQISVVKRKPLNEKRLLVILKYNKL